MQFLLVVLSALAVTVVSGEGWCYQPQVSCNDTCRGPAQWGRVSAQCSGRSQSPVNVVTRTVLPDGRLTPFQLTGYQNVFDGLLLNNGHTVQLNLPTSIKVKGGNLPATYKALQLHLHWGTDGGPGSEHTIDGERYPMEMHIVHIKEKYPSISEALKDRTGVAVLGFFFQESRSANAKFVPFINALKNITQPTNSTTLKGVTLEMFTPPQKNMTKYFRYDGSLTTPNCAEAVVWSLFEYPIPLSREQLVAFSQLQFASGQRMVETYRPVLPLNGRQVYYSGGQVAVLSSVVLLTSVLCSAFSLQTV
ncbi:carbonic anhydrase 4b [Takifugu rubripes]|uniref:Carbonic anhydrase n=1 Tax=Takifugu rubripes TaxID=31033 RepID=H2ST55_TAKRU|nr:carbonic anhydrase 4-like [Takifugu rubripes]|eukprot:XP_011606861.1 PREDICTED: carbonic anhydrase 4-like [Takifugu rubripes]